MQKFLFINNLLKKLSTIPTWSLIMPNLKSNQLSGYFSSSDKNSFLGEFKLGRL